MATSHIFRIMFVNQGKVYEVYARKVSHGEPVRFHRGRGTGLRRALLASCSIPREERIKGEFAGVKRTFLPMHSILRIDEVKKQGVSKITALEGGANVTQFPDADVLRSARREEVSPGACSCLPGRPALSDFRIAKLLQRLQALDAAVRGLSARFVHFADLASPAQRLAARACSSSCCAYGPRRAGERSCAEWCSPF